MAALDLRLLGSPRIHLDGAPVRPLRTRKGYALLALLAERSPEPIARDEAIARLWPDAVGDAGAGSLRRALTDLRAALGPAADRIVADRRTLRLTLHPGDTCDTLALDDALRRWEHTGARDAAEAAACLAAGRATGREAALLLALDALAADALERDPPRALRFARDAVERAPLSDAAQRRLYEALAAVGDLPGALRAWRDFRLRLQSEGLTPDAATVRCIARLRAARAQRRPPAFVGALVGRAADQERLARRLTAERLVTVVGPGGVGKTRLCAAVAAGRDAVWVDLAPLEPSAGVGAAWGAIADALGATGASARAAVAEALRERPCLVVLDNAEHVAPAAGAAVAALLADAPGARALVSSRTPLGVAGEGVATLAPLPESDACALFVCRAEAVGADLTRADDARIVVICRLLDGLPLAVEFAAARARLLPLERIAAELERGPQALRGAGGTGNPRHRTLEETLDWSVLRLDDAERALFAALSLWPDGWTAEAAEALLGAPADAPLARLVEHSLATRVGDRFRYLATTRALAQARLAARDDAALFAARAVGWARALAERIDAGIWSPEGKAWASRHATEAANLRAAVGRASGTDALTIAARLGQGWWRRRAWREGRETLRVALSRPGADPKSPDGAEARWLAALFGWRLGEVERAELEAALSEMLAGRERDGAHEMLTYLHHTAGTCRLEWGDADGAIGAFDRALAHAEATGDPFLIAYARNGAAVGARCRADFAEALASGAAAAAHFASVGNTVLEADTRNQIGLAQLAAGDLDAARATLTAALELALARGAEDVAADARLALGETALAAGDRAGAEAHFAEAALQARAHDEPRALARALDGLARVAAVP